MRTLTLLLAILALPATTFAADVVSAPWEEFKMLYRESIERRIEERTAQPQPVRKPQRHTIEQAIYRLTIGGNGAQGEALISGRILSGDPAPIPLFDADLVISGVTRIAGGSLIASTTGAAAIQFLPDGAAPDFEIALTFMIGQREDNRSKMVGFTIPPALRNALKLALPADSELNEGTPLIPPPEGADMNSPG
jgi:hypothetical protein